MQSDDECKMCNDMLKGVVHTMTRYDEKLKYQSHKLVDRIDGSLQNADEKKCKKVVR